MFEGDEGVAGSEGAEELVDVFELPGCVGVEPGDEEVWLVLAFEG